MMPYLTPAIFESEDLTNRIKPPFPVRVAGRCEPRGRGGLTPALYPASFSTPCVTPIFWGKPSFGSSRRTCQIRLICEWDFGLTCLADPHRLEKILSFQTPHKNGPMGAGMGIRGCFLTPAAKASHKPIQAVIEGISPL